MLFPKYQNLRFGFLGLHPKYSLHQLVLGNLSNLACHWLTMVPVGTPTFWPCTVTDAVLSRLSNLLGPEPSIVKQIETALFVVQHCLKYQITNIRYYFFYQKHYTFMLMSYSYSPALNLLSVLPHAPFALSVPTVWSVSPSAILSRSTLTLISKVSVFNG